ncbi:MAG: hypothetical protein AAGA20_13475 [Planctomycetota bacterium]
MKRSRLPLLLGAVAASSCITTTGYDQPPPQRDPIPSYSAEPRVVGRPVQRGGAPQAPAARPAGETTVSAAPPPAATPPPTSPALFGALRHVQVLGVTGGDAGERSVRLATARSTGARSSQIDVHEIAFDGAETAEQSLGTPTMSIELPFDVLDGWTWSDRRPWRLVDVGGTSVVVARDPIAQRLVVTEAASGERLFERDGCLTLEDARARDGGVDVILRATGGLRMIELSRAGSVRGWRELPASDLEDSVACFVANEAGEPSIHEAIVAGFRANTLVLAHADLAVGSARSFTVDVEQPRRSELRVTAWGRGPMCRIAVGLPDAGGSGLVALVADDYGSEPELLHVVAAAAPDGGAGSLARGFGRLLRFVDDLNGDGLPELAIGIAEDLVRSASVALVDHASGQRVRAYAKASETTRKGTDLSVDPSGRYLVLSAVGPPWAGESRTDGWALTFDTREDGATLPALVASEN